MVIRDWFVRTLFTTALCGSAFAVDTPTSIGGTVGGVLSQERSPYVVSETLVVPDDSTLKIEPGVELRFKAGTGLDVRGGALVVDGKAMDPVVFTSEKEDSPWKGVSVTGLQRASLRWLLLSNAEYGVSVENGMLEYDGGLIESTNLAAIYCRRAYVDLKSVHIAENRGIGVWATEESKLSLTENTQIAESKLALVAEGSDVRLQAVVLDSNEVGILNLGSNYFVESNLKISRNEVALVSDDVPFAATKGMLSGNKHNKSKDFDRYEEDLMRRPHNRFAKNIHLTPLNENRDTVWNLTGNVGLAAGYHHVFMKHNHSHEPYVSDGDTVEHGDRYINYFQVPGFFMNLNANLLMEAPSGQTIEFATDIGVDKWQRFNIHNVQAVYTDKFQRIALGDVFLKEGDLYLSGISAFGGSYSLKLFKNAAQDPLFETMVFVGETNAPKLIGDRNDDVYKDYIEDGEAEAQEMVVGGKIRWNMHRRFNGSLGYIGSRDYVDDPFLRDGMSTTVNTADPLVTSRTFFADCNWLFFPTDIKLNGQVAVGVADTANVARIRAINQVFAEAGLDASNYALLNKLMKDPKEVASLSHDQLESIFGQGTLKTPNEMRAELRRLLAKASDVAKNMPDSESRPSHSDFWGHEHWAFAGSYEWSNDRTFIEGFFRYVGREYYSAGSPDMLQNTRMIGGNLKQRIFDFWNLGFGYTMNVENAADDSDGYNIFGMAEGSQWGMFSGAEDSWLEEHEQDAVRTLYDHDAYLKNDFKLGSRVSLSTKYSVNYRTRSTAQRLYADYSAGSGIYDDPWFAVRSGKATMEVANGNDTLEIDSARWAKYFALSDEEYLATQFDEKLLKHTLELGLTINLPKNELKVGGVWIYRTDLSEFVQDDLLDGFDFEDETYGILGYYFHGSDFFEMRYPVSLSTTLDGVRNQFSVTPRYKIYNRNEMRELELSGSDRLEVDLSKDFLLLTLGAGMRYNVLNYEIESEEYEDREIDVDGSASLRVYHTKSLYSDWTVGSLFYYRPDSRADEYKDLYFIAALNYDF